jgi:pimeloyl-ACP methyl ester carboxylesterase
MWANQLPAFAAHYRVISYDLRRYGDSNMPLGDFANHQDLAALLEGQGIERAALVGCSLGGKIAIDAALALPALVSAGVLADSMRDARQVTMPGVAHLPNMEHPDAFNRIALEFLPAAQL